MILCRVFVQVIYYDVIVESLFFLADESYTELTHTKRTQNTLLKFINVGNDIFVVINKSGNRISSLEANKEEEYRCPVCGRKVVLKSGSIRFLFLA